MSHLGRPNVANTLPSVKTRQASARSGFAAANAIHLHRHSALEDPLVDALTGKARMQRGRICPLR